MKRIISLSMVIVMCLGVFGGLSVRADGVGCDIIFAVDDTVSMRQNDPNNAVSAAISEALSSLGEDSGYRIGAVAYGLEAVTTFPVCDFSQQIKQDFDSYTQTKLTRSAKGTDYAVGLVEADKMSPETASKAIILIAGDDNDYQQSGRTAEMTAADTLAVTDKGYPVYVVGLNSGEQTKAELEAIAAKAQTTAYFPVGAEEIKTAVGSIVADIIAKNQQSAQAAVQSEAVQTVSADGQSQAVNPSNALNNANAITAAFNSGDTHNFEFDVFQFAKSGVIRIEHAGEITAALKTPSGLPVSFGAGSATLTKGDGYSEIHINTPINGKWILSVTDTASETIRVIPHFDYKVRIKFNTNSNVIYTGVSAMYSVNIEVDEDTGLDAENLTVRLYIKDDETSDVKDMYYHNNRYECTYTAKTMGNKDISAVVLLDGGNIESDPISVMVVSNPNKDGNSSLWIKIIIAAIVALVAVGYLIKYRKQINAFLSLKKMYGVISIEIKQSTLQPVFYRDLSEFGKRKSLYDIIQNRALLEIQEVFLCGTSTGIKVMSTGSARIRYTHVSSDPDGVVIKYGQGFKVFLGDNRTEIMVNYMEELPEEAKDETQSSPANV